MNINIESSVDLTLADLEWLGNEVSGILYNSSEYVHSCLNEICSILFGGGSMDPKRLVHLAECIDSGKPAWTMNNISTDRCIADILFTRLLKFAFTDGYQHLFYQMLSNISNFYYLLNSLEIKRMRHWREISPISLIYQVKFV